MRSLNPAPAALPVSALDPLLLRKMYLDWLHVERFLVAQELGAYTEDGRMDIPQCRDRAAADALMTMDAAKAWNADDRARTVLLAVGVLTEAEDVQCAA